MFDLRSSKGALLFETFIALMILSVGITSSLRVFSESLYTAKKNQEKGYIKEGLNRLLFDWYANPESIPLTEGGYMMVPLRLKDEDAPELWVEIRTKEVHPAVLQNESEENSEAEAPNKGPTKEKSGMNLEVSLDVLKERNIPVYELQTVLYKPNQEKNDSQSQIQK